ncbi:MAG: hypothetical protein JF621_06320 [Streptomyces turgidiscabies]|nr:hypothetical protein [Streptomyces turgidiscabies]
MAAEYDGVDALMAALTDDPLPEEALGDADFMAEHWSAAADVALLREQLGLIGDALASQEHTEPTPDPVRKPARVPVRVHVREWQYWRPLRTLALGVAAVSTAGALITGSGWLLSQAGGGAEDAGTTSADSASASRAPHSDAGGGAKYESGAPGSAAYLACARLVVEGTITAADLGPGDGQYRITLRVTHYYKPDKGPAEVTFVSDRETTPGVTVGDHTLIGVPKDAGSPVTWTTGEKEIAAERPLITAALPESRTLPCR